jgi:DNA gyrase subunit B
MEEKVRHSYDESDIQVLEGLEAVRKRPGMYIGTTSIRGLHHLVWEIVDNSIDEALAGYCNEIRVILEKDDVVKVIDNGRGMPTGIHAKTGLSTVETIFTVLHAGGKFGGGGYKVSGGLHGVGASVVNALSEWLEVYVHRDGHIYYQKFENGGSPVESLKIIGDCDDTGTTVVFKADAKIFDETTVYDYDTLNQRIRELAFFE